MPRAPIDLGAVCAANILSTKWLLAPSNRIGHQWIESLVRSGQPAVNLRPTTLTRLALDLVSSDLAEHDLAFAGRDALELAIGVIWNELAADGYLRRLEQTDDLSTAVLESILSLRLAGASAEQIDGAGLENPSKAKDIRDLFQGYTQFLKAHPLVDTADVLQRAIAKLKTDPLAIAPDTFILVPIGFPASGLERTFLNALPPSQYLEIKHPMERGDPSASDIGLLAYLGRTSVAPAPSSDDSVRFFRAVGEVNEVREVLRRCLAEGIRLDDVEILHPEAETYVPLIYSIARRHSSDDRPDGIPITFAEGIPAILSRPGRALAAWLLWIDEGYPQRLLVEMIGEGLLDCGDDDLSFSYLARLLRPLGIGWNADKYLPKLDEQIQATRSKPPQPREDGADHADEVEAHKRRLKGLRHLRKLVDSLLKLSRIVSSDSGPAILGAVEDFVGKSARSVSELDGYAAQALIEHLQDRRLWLERLKLAPNLKWLRNLPAQTRVLGSSPRPGHLHVAHLGSGGHSGRKQTFVVGLDDRRFPGSAIQDPILLDRERQKLSPEIATSADRLHRKLGELAKTLSRLAGTVTLSWPCHDLSDDRETFPSSVILAAYRMISQRQDIDLEALNAAIGPPVSFSPTAPEKALDESERWLWWLSHDDTTQGTSQLASVESRFPHLARGSYAEQQQSAGFGPFNGFVPLAGQALNPFTADGPILSASALETAGRCPLAFFFRNGLGLYPQEELEVDLDRWIDPAQFGSLLHETFRQFMAELAAEGKRSEFERDHMRLANVLADQVQRWRQDVPPPNESAFRKQYWQLVRTARIFLQAEEEFCQTNQPRYFEVALGLDEVVNPSPLDRTAPVTITLANGRTIRARGQIDRVDETGKKQYAVWDYKVGSGYGYDRADPFLQGRRVQSVMYLRMIETALREQVDPQATVERFGYFFPSIRAHGLRVHWDAQTLSGGIDILDRLCSSIAEGAFPATDDSKDCSYCDYASICRDVTRVTSDSKALLDRTDLVQLGHFQELRRG